MGNRGNPRQHTGDERGGAPAGNSNAAVTGHRGALTDYEKRRPFSAIALAEMERVAQELDEHGLQYGVEQDALLLTMLSELYRKHVLHVIGDKEDTTPAQLGRLIDQTSKLVARAQKAKLLCIEMGKHAREQEAPVIDVEATDVETNA